MNDASSATTSSENTDGPVGSLEVNWEEFSFRAELEARKLAESIFRNEVTGLFNRYLESVKASPISDDIDIKSRYRDLQKQYEHACKESEKLMTEWEKLQEEVETLKSKRSCLESTLKEAEEEGNRMREEFKSHKAAYEKALDKYCTNFDLQVEIKSRSETGYEALIKFGSRPDMQPIRIVVNRKERKILEFDTSKVFPTEDKGLQEEFKDRGNIPSLLCAVREWILQR